MAPVGLNVPICEMGGQSPALGPTLRQVLGSLSICPSRLELGGASVQLSPLQSGSWRPWRRGSSLTWIAAAPAQVLPRPWLGLPLVHLVHGQVMSARLSCSLLLWV